MFNLTIVTKSEKLLWRHQVEELQDRCRRLEDLVLHERHRAEAAINALLAKTAQVVISPNPTEVESDKEVMDFERIMERTMDLFGEDEAKAKEQAAFMDRLQS